MGNARARGTRAERVAQAKRRNVSRALGDMAPLMIDDDYRQTEAVRRHATGAQRAMILGLAMASIGGVRR